MRPAWSVCLVSSFQFSTVGNNNMAGKRICEGTAAIVTIQGPHMTYGCKRGRPNEISLTSFL
jgi:hypothetical protein